MTYQNRYGKYAVKIDGTTYAWFKNYDKAVAEFEFYAKAPEELEGTLTLEDIKTGGILKSVEPVEEQETIEEESTLTIKEYIINAALAAAEERLNKLTEMGAPQVIIEGQSKLVASLRAGEIKIGGDTQVLTEEVKATEVKTGNGGKKYIVFNDGIHFFPQARYGMYIKDNR